MNVKKVFSTIVVAGALIATSICVYVYFKAFTPNTNFSQKEVFVYIPTNSTYEDVKGIMEPMVKNFGKFDFVATSKHNSHTLFTILCCVIETKETICF